MDSAIYKYKKKEIEIFYPVNIPDMTIKNLKLGKLYNKKLLMIYENCLERGNNVLYIGAYIGTHAFIIKEIIGDGQMILFEPQSRIAKCLVETIIKNKIENINVIEKCVGCSDDECDFFTTDNSKATMTFLAPRLHNRYITKKSVVCIDDTIDMKINFIKIDCEGSEFLALLGCKNLINEQKPLICISTSDIVKLNTWCNENNYISENWISSYYLLINANDYSNIE